MKTKYINILLMTILLSSCSNQNEHIHNYVFSSIDKEYHSQECQECHEKKVQPHSFTQNMVSSNYLFKSASCANKAEYYKSCICGLSSKGTTEEDTFIDTQSPPIEHSLTFHERVEATPETNGNEAYYTCNECKKIFNSNKNEISTIPVLLYEYAIKVSKKSGKDFDPMYTMSRRYLTTSDPAMYLFTGGSGYGDRTNGITLSWTVKNKSTYTVEFATKNDFSDVYLTYTGLTSETLIAYNFIPGINYYRIVDTLGNVSETDSFNVIGPVRTIHTDGIYNMRDLGGWTTSDGKTIKYGKLFRSASWDNGNDFTKSVLNNLAIKTELDIRLSSSGNDYSKSKFPVEGINFINLGIGQYTQVVPEGKHYSANLKANIGQIFSLLADEKNYPLTYHCSAGADRTGTLCFLIFGALGVEYEQLVQDYELTTWYHGKRWRSNIEYDSETKGYSFTEDGIMQEDSGNYCAFELLKRNILEYYPTIDNKLSSSIKKYLLDECGVTNDTILKICQIMTN